MIITTVPFRVHGEKQQDLVLKTDLSRDKKNSTVCENSSYVRTIVVFCVCLADFLERYTTSEHRAHGFDMNDVSAWPLKYYIL